MASFIDRIQDFKDNLPDLVSNSIQWSLGWNNLTAIKDVTQGRYKYHGEKTPAKPFTQMSTELFHASSKWTVLYGLLSDQCTKLNICNVSEPGSYRDLTEHVVHFAADKLPGAEYIPSIILSTYGGISLLGAGLYDGNQIEEIWQNVRDLGSSTSINENITHLKNVAMAIGKIAHMTLPMTAAYNRYGMAGVSAVSTLMILADFVIKKIPNEKHQTWAENAKLISSIAIGRHYEPALFDMFALPFKIPLKVLGLG